MKYLLLGIIKLYWIIPAKRRRKCLFKISCSQHIYAVTVSHGFVSGVKSFISRYKQCRTGYAVYVADDLKEWVIFKDGSIINKSETNI